MIAHRFVPILGLSQLVYAGALHALQDDVGADTSLTVLDVAR